MKQTDTPGPNNSTERPRRRAGLLAVAGTLAFVALVCVLHLTQPDYNPTRQLMSELALGEHGWLMLPAFICLAAAPLSLAWGLSRLRRAALPRSLLVLAGLGYLGAGLLPLDRSVEGHIACVALAFVAVVLAMCLLPAALPTRFGGATRLASWGLAAGTAASVLLGGTFVPTGVAQRLAAACVAAWFCLIGVELVR